MAANTWDNSTVDGKWSTDANWSLGHVPTNTETATFDATSVTNCAIDLAADVLGIDITAAYSGVITQGAFDITIGTGGFTQAAGTFTGSIGQWITCAGNWTYTAGVVTSDVSRVRMTGAGTTFSSNTGAYHTIRISAAGVVMTSIGAGTTCDNLSIDVGASFLLTAGKVLTYYTGNSLNGDLFNSGDLGGAGTFKIMVYNSDKPLTLLGRIAAPILIEAHAAMTANRTVTLGASAAIGTITIDSAHATRTMTLNLNGHRLECSSLTVGTRGNITGLGDSSIFCKGALTQSDATPITICNGGYPLWASGGQTGMGVQSNYVGNGRSMCRMMARNMPKKLSQKWGVG